jgi:hypothetical protein
MRTGPSKILDYLFLGNYLDGRAVERLRGLGITEVLNVSDSARFIEDSGIRVHHIPISDFGDTNLSEVFKSCFTIIQKCNHEGKRILVHCRHGQNRSPSVVLGYLISHDHMTLKRAYELVTSVRPIISVHERYFEQLQILEEKTYGTITLHQTEIGPSVQQLIREMRIESLKNEKK